MSSDSQLENDWYIIDNDTEEVLLGPRPAIDVLDWLTDEPETKYVWKKEKYMSYDGERQINELWVSIIARKMELNLKVPDDFAE